jgi:dihydroorotase-like cyclic amidohydrolase
VGADGYVSRSSNSCFERRTLRGRIMLTLAAGAVVYRRPMLVREEHAGSSAGATQGEAR